MPLTPEERHRLDDIMMAKATLWHASLMLAPRLEMFDVFVFATFLRCNSRQEAACMGWLLAEVRWEREYWQRRERKTRHG